MVAFNVINFLIFKFLNPNKRGSFKNAYIFVVSFVFLFGLFFSNLVFAQEKKIVVANDFSQVLFYDIDGQFLSSFGLPEGFAGQNNLAVGDVDGDYENEIVVMSKSDGSQILIFSEAGILKYSVYPHTNTLVWGFTSHAKNFGVGVYHKNRSSGNHGNVFLVLGDLDDDGKAEIIVSVGPYIEIFDFNGNLKEKFAPFSKNFRQDIKIAAGDIDRDRKDEIIFLTRNYSNRLFIYKNKKIFSLAAEFDKKIIESDFSISFGDLEGDGKAEFGICSSSANSECQISRFDHENIAWPNNLIFENNLNLKLKDVDDDGRAEAVIAESFGGRINIFKINPHTKNFGVGVNGSAANWKTIYTLQNISDTDVFAQKEKIKAKVIYVDDGDTIFLDNGQEIRYIGVDTPEIGEPFYLEAANLNKELIYGREVTIEYDKQKIDPYGRYLAYVFSNGTFINEELLKSGFAKTEFIFPDIKYSSKLFGAEKEAKENKVGRWK